MSISLSHEIDYSPKAELHPNYRLDQLTQQTGGTSVTLTAAGGNNSLFEINPVAFNLSKSFLCFDYVTAVAPAADRVAGVFRSVLPHIRQIQFYGRNGQMMCDLQNFDIYSRVIFNSDFTIEELENGSNDTPVYMNNTNVTDDLVYETAAGPPPVLALYATSIKAANGTRPGMGAGIGGRANLSYKEQIYYEANQPAPGPAATATTTRYRIPLSFFRNTIFALDKDLYFGDITYLRIYWNDYTKLGYNSDGNGGNLTPFAAQIALNNLYVYLAVETNEKINATLAQTISSNIGLNTLFDYVYHENFSPTGNQPSFYVKYGPGMGLRLKRLYWCTLDNPIGADDDTYNISNMAGAELNSFYAELDGQRIIQYDINCQDANGNQDYMILYDRLKGGAIQNRNIYQYNWFWCESFDGLKLHEHDDNLEAGIDIDKVEHKYQVYARTDGNPYSWYIYAVIQRRLNITNLGVTII